MKTKLKGGDLFVHLLLLLIIAGILYPIIFAASSSIKSMSEVMGNVLGLIPKRPTLESYKTITTKVPFLKIVFNTVTIASIAMLFKIVTSFIVAYSFVFFAFPGKNALYFVLISTMFIPFTVTMIPNYITISRMGLLNNIYGVVLPQLSDAMGIFLLRQHMRGVPLSLIEAAKLERTPHLTIMARVILPVIRPAIISTGIIFFVNSWNEYVWPKLILRTEGNFTLSLAAQVFLGAEGSADMNISMAMAVATMIIPLVLFLSCQKFIMSTFATSGIK